MNRGDQIFFFLKECEIQSVGISCTGDNPVQRSRVPPNIPDWTYSSATFSLTQELF